MSYLLVLAFEDLNRLPFLLFRLAQHLGFGSQVLVLGNKLSDVSDLNRYGLVITTDVFQANRTAERDTADVMLELFPEVNSEDAEAAGQPCWCRVRHSTALPAATESKTSCRHSQLP
jgi:hypothetical protein